MSFQKKPRPFSEKRKKFPPPPPPKRGKKKSPPWPAPARAGSTAPLMKRGHYSGVRPELICRYFCNKVLWVAPCAKPHQSNNDIHEQNGGLVLGVAGS